MDRHGAPIMVTRSIRCSVPSGAGVALFFLAIVAIAQDTEARRDSTGLTLENEVASRQADESGVYLPPFENQGATKLKPHTVW